MNFPCSTEPLSRSPSRAVALSLIEDAWVRARPVALPARTVLVSHFDLTFQFLVSDQHRACPPANHALERMSAPHRLGVVRTAVEGRSSLSLVVGRLRRFTMTKPFNIEVQQPPGVAMPPTELVVGQPHLQASVHPADGSVDSHSPTGSLRQPMIPNDSHPPDKSLQHTGGWRRGVTHGVWAR